MSSSNEMEQNLIQFLSTLIIEKDDDAPFRLMDQESNLAEKQCTDQRLGNWIDRCDFPFMIDTLMLDHAVFSEEFPDVRFPQNERADLARLLETHCEECVRCSLKRSYDLEWQARVDNAIKQNKGAIGEAIAHAVGKK